MTFSSGVELDDILKHPFNVCHMYRQTVLLCQIIKSDFSPKFWMDLLMLSLSWSLRKSSQITHQLPRHLLSLYYRENYLEKYLLFIFVFLLVWSVCVCVRSCMSSITFESVPQEIQNRKLRLQKRIWLLISVVQKSRT